MGYASAQYTTALVISARLRGTESRCSMSRGTTHRTVRIEDELWAAARQVATERGENLSEVIRRALVEYVEKGSGNE